jgi:hypothetical protein
MTWVIVMHEEWLDDELRRAMDSKTHHPAPEFDAVMRAAEQRLVAGRTRLRITAVAAMFGLVAIMMVRPWSSTPEKTDDEFLIAASMLGTTSWFAPSDVLLPQRRFDIYHELPTFIESTELKEGTLL